MNTDILVDVRCRDYTNSINRNTYYYYNHVILKYMAATFDWMGSIGFADAARIDGLIAMLANESKHDYNSYCKIYDEYLSRYPHIFRNGGKFIDFGCAPGGFIEYANRVGMSGTGITLPESDKSALKMNPKIKSKLTNINIIYANLLDEGFMVDVTHGNGTYNIEPHTYDFINLGAVLYDKNDSSATQLMQERLFMNQLYIAKHALKDGGSFMFVLDVSILLNLTYILNILLNDTAATVHFIPVQPSFLTMQVYVLVENVTITDKMFQQMYMVYHQQYSPVSNRIQDIVNVFANNRCDIASLTEAYYIKVFMHNTIRTSNTIYAPIFSTVSLDFLHKMEYNTAYFKYYDKPYGGAPSVIYCASNLPDVAALYNKIDRIRMKCIDEMGLQVDGRKNIVHDVKDIDKMRMINKAVVRIYKSILVMVANL